MGMPTCMWAGSICYRLLMHAHAIFTKLSFRPLPPPNFKSLGTRLLCNMQMALKLMLNTVVAAAYYSKAVTQ